jgi:hypothetical protein
MHTVSKSRRLSTGKVCKSDCSLQFFNGSSILEEQIGKNSRCFMARRVPISENSPVDAVCLEFKCSFQGVNVTVAPGGTSTLCPFNQEVWLLSSYFCGDFLLPAVCLPACNTVRCCKATELVQHKQTGAARTQGHSWAMFLLFV